MKNKNIYFVGYYKGIKDKKKYVDLFNCKNKFFLESNIKHTNNNSVQYFPEQIYKIKTKVIDLFKVKKIIVDSLVRDMYKRDLKHYKTLNVNIYKFSRFKKVSLLLLFSFQNFNKNQKGLSKFNILKFFSEFLRLMKMYKSKDTKFLTIFKNFMFRMNFIIGYNHSKGILDSLSYDKNDIYIVWGRSFSSRILLLNYLKEHDISYYISEYGEIPGTISCSPYGIFGEACSDESWKELYEKEIHENDINQTRTLLNTIKTGQISTRSYDPNMYFLMKYFYENSVKKENTKKIIYVNGAELFSSGLYWNRWNIGNQGKHPNKFMLEQVVSYFDKDDYMIIYKEHPMTRKSNKNARLLKSDFPTVNFIDSMNIHDILDMADIVITFPSKVVMTSIEYNNRTFVLGDFTIPHSMPSINYFTSRNFEDIKELLNNNVSINNQDYIEFVARMLKYSLIICDDKLHSNFNHAEEQYKLESILKV